MLATDNLGDFTVSVCYGYHAVLPPVMLSNTSIWCPLVAALLWVTQLTGSTCSKVMGSSVLHSRIHSYSILTSCTVWTANAFWKIQPPPTKFTTFLSMLQKKCLNIQLVLQHINHCFSEDFVDMSENFIT